MKTQTLTCIECPMGCEITVTTDGNNVVSSSGYTCKRGKAYAESEVICPKRIVTSTVKTTDGRMLPVKTSDPVKKSEIFEVMRKIASVTVKPPIKIHDVIVKDISDGVDLIATDDLD